MPPQSASQARHYQEHKEDYKKRAHNRKKREVDNYRKVKSSTPCADCGNTYPWYVMDYDHISGEKSGMISKMTYNGAYAKLRIEMEKVELVCSNCHRERTYQRSLVD